MRLRDRPSAVDASESWLSIVMSPDVDKIARALLDIVLEQQQRDQD